METKSAIENRRSIRNFKQDENKKEILEDILNCGRLAPSAKNRQPWYFIVLTSNLKNKVADLMIERSKSQYGKQEAEKLKYKSSVNPTAEAIKQAPVLVLIFRPKDNDWIVGDNLSIGACVENMCLRATDLGIGSLWIRDVVYVSESVAKMLNYHKLELNCALSLGVANEKPKQRPRNELNDIVKWL